MKTGKKRSKKAYEKEFHAKDAMFAATDTPISPWHVVSADDKRSAQLNCIAHFLGQLPYSEVRAEKVELSKRQKAKGYERPEYPYRFVPATYSFA